MAQNTSLQQAIARCKARLKQLDTQLSAVSTTAVSPGTTSETSGALSAKVDVITTGLTVMSKELSDINACLVS